jgi:hypothetical protein
MNYLVTKSDREGNLIADVSCEIELQILKVKGSESFVSVFTKSAGHRQLFLDHFRTIKSKCADSCFGYDAQAVVEEIVKTTSCVIF